MFSSGDNCSFAVLPSSPFWHFSYGLVTVEANVCTVGFSTPSRPLSCLCRAGRGGRPGRRRGHLGRVQDRLRFRPPFERGS